jgi:hypothetical protein
VGKAMERTTNMAKFYRRSWYDFARKWYKIMEANSRGNKTLFKTARNGKVFQKTIYRGDWISEAGYEPMVRSSSEQEQESIQGIQKFQFLINMSPNNLALRKIAQKRSLEIVDLSPDEMHEIEEAEEQMQKLAEQQAQFTGQPTGPQLGQPAPQAQPINEEREGQEVARLLEELAI